MDPTSARHGTAAAPSAAVAAACDRLQAMLAAWLDDIDFDEVTLEDRLTFVECVVAHQVRSAVRSRRFELAPHYRRVGEQMADELRAREAWRSGMSRGVFAVSGYPRPRSTR
jgi:hypothetical protein